MEVLFNQQDVDTLQDEERALKAQYDQLCLEEARLDAELMEKKAALEERTEEEASRWRQFRDNHRCVRHAFCTAV